MHLLNDEKKREMYIVLGDFWFAFPGLCGLLGLFLGGLFFFFRKEKSGEKNWFWPA